MIPVTEPSVIVYVLEWGLDSTYSTDVENLSTVYTTVEVACAKAMTFDNKPSIVKYDLTNHIVLEECSDVIALDKAIGA